MHTHGRDALQECAAWAGATVKRQPEGWGKGGVAGTRSRGSQPLGQRDRKEVLEDHVACRRLPMAEINAL